MRLSTPKRYQPARGQRRHLINSRRWIWLWLLTPVVALAGYYIYEQRATLGPPIREFIADRFEDAQSGVATITAPTPLPTTDPTERIARADGLWTQGALEAALDEYQVAREGAPNDARVYYRYAYGLLVEGRVSEALVAAEDTVTANPFASDAWAIRAFALARNDRYAEAVASALQALSLDPTNSSALAYMGLAYFRAGQPAQAEQAISRALDADPENPEVYYVRGLYNFESNYLPNDYLEDMQQAHELAPNLPHITVELAWAYWNVDQADVGLEKLNEVIEQNPGNLDALYALGWFWAQTYGDYPKALDYLEQCISVDPENLACLDYLATVQLALLDTEAALQTYRQLMNTQPLDSRYYLRAGRTFANANQCTVAVPWLEQGYELEQARGEPSLDRLAAFEEFLLSCGAAINPVYASPEDLSATAEPGS